MLDAFRLDRKTVDKVLHQLLDVSPMIYINGWFFLRENLHRKPWDFPMKSGGFR